jgi:hypothetical protein
MQRYSQAIVVGLFFCSAQSAFASAITLTPVSPTYSYDAGSTVPDSNATAIGSYFHSGSPTDPSGYWAPANQTDTVTYEFQGTKAFATLTVDSKAAVFNGSAGSNWVGAFSTDGGATFTPFFSATDSPATNNQPQTDILNVYGDTDVILRYTGTNDVSGDFWLQLFRSSGPTGSEDFTFSATAAFATPEPSSVVALCGLGAMGLFLFIRRQRKS